MNHLANVTLKELKDLFTPSAVATLFVLVVVFASLGTALRGADEGSSEDEDFGVAYAGDPDGRIAAGGIEFTVRDMMVAGYIANHGGVTPEEARKHVIFTDAFDEDGIFDWMEDNGMRYAVGAPDADRLRGGISKERMPFRTYYIFENGGILGAGNSSVPASIVAGASAYVSALLIKAGMGSDAPAAVRSPFYADNSDARTRVNGEAQDAEPGAIASALAKNSMVIPIIITFVIMMVGSMVIASIGSEKENKTLETLLTMPVRRTTVISGKLLAATLFGLFYGAVFMVGMKVYTNGIMDGSGDVDLASLGLSMGAGDWALLFILLFLAIFTALGICMILGAFTKNYKTAQTMTTPIAFLAFVPMIVFMITSWGALPGVARGIMFAIPFSHPMMAMNNLMFGDYATVFAGIVYLTILDALLMYATVKIYKSDILVTGLSRSGGAMRLGSVFAGKWRRDDEGR